MSEDTDQPAYPPSHQSLHRLRTEAAIGSLATHEPTNKDSDQTARIDLSLSGIFVGLLCSGSWHILVKTGYFITYPYLSCHQWLVLLLCYWSVHWHLQPHKSRTLKRRSQAVYEPRHVKTDKMSVRPAKTQISLGIRQVWSVFTVRMKKVWFFSYQLSAQRMPSLIWVFAGLTFILLVLSCRGSYLTVLLLICCWWVKVVLITAAAQLNWSEYDILISYMIFFASKRTLFQNKWTYY